MPSDDPQTVIFPSDFGLVGNYDPTTLSKLTANGSLRAGRYYLRATLDDMIKIRSMCRSLDENHHDLLRETRAQHDDLMRQMKELQSLKNRSWIFKLFNRGARKRAKRAFVADTIELWDSTATTSDSMKRTILSTATADLAQVEGSVPRDERVSGLAMDLNGPVTQEAVTIAREIMSILASGNPFADPTPSNSQDEQASTERTVPEAEALSSARSSISTSPSSPSTASSFSYHNLNLNLNIINNTDSNPSGVTINNNGHGNSGSEHAGLPDHRSSVNSPPS